MTAGISAKLHGSQEAGDQLTPGDATDVPQGIDADVWAKANASARDPNAPDHDLADALLTLAARIADLEGAQQP
jgi:hypothetical protein